MRSGLSSLEISSGHRQERIQILESTTAVIQASMRIYSLNAWLQQYRWEIRRTALLTSSAYLLSITMVFSSPLLKKWRASRGLHNTLHLEEENWEVRVESSYWSIQEPLGHQWGPEIECLEQEAWGLQPSTAAPWSGADHNKHWFIKDSLSLKFCSIIKLTFIWPIPVKRPGMPDTLYFTFSRKVFGGIPASVEISIQCFFTEMCNC